MSTIIDKRGSNKGRLAGSRAKFIKRYKGFIRGKIDKHIKNTNIKDIGEDVEVNIDKKSIEEERLRYDHDSSNHKRVLPGNKKYDKGDSERMTGGAGKGSRASKDGIGEDDFKFILSKEEFLDLLFEGMALPNFIKKNTKGHAKIKYVTGGFIKEGVPTRLAIKKTMEMAIARRTAMKGYSDKKPRFIDDTDLRYRHVVPQEYPISTAVMFCIMDISGSMSERHKLIAKKFFLLLFLFLNKNYKNVQVRFISHTHFAKEVEEKEFFYSKEMGGTMVSPAIKLANEIIDKEYDAENTNIYIAQASDGDNWSNDYDDLQVEVETLLEKVQYMAYIEIDNSYPDEGVAAFYDMNFEDNEKLNSAIVADETQVVEVLHQLFGKDR